MPASKNGSCHLGIFEEVGCDWKSSNIFKVVRRVKFRDQQQFFLVIIYVAGD